MPDPEIPTPTAAANSGPSLQSAQAAAAEDVTRSFPHAIGPEKSILSSMLNDPAGCIGRAIEEGITKEHFYLPAHAKLFAVVQELYEASKPVELVSLVQLLHDRGLLDAVGGPSAVTDLYTYAPNAGHFQRHLQIVKDKFVLRSIIRTSTEAITRAYDAPEEVAELLDQVEADILGIRNGVQAVRESNIREQIDEAIRNFEKLLSGEVESLGIPTGYDELDKRTGGLKGGEMFVIAARPSMGKPSLVMNIVEQICIDQGKPSMFFSCEMGAGQIVQRLLFSRAGYDYSQLKKQMKPNKGELQRIMRSSTEIAGSKLFIDDTPNISINELRAKARRRKREDDIQLIAIDYLQLMRSRTRQAENSREREIAEISSGIKGLAKELDIPVIVLAQLNRGPESRTGKSTGVPRMSDLRESGSIEQDADLVGLLYRTAYYAEDPEEKAAAEGEAFLELAKNRNGETGRIPLTFISHLMRFKSGEPAPDTQH